LASPVPPTPPSLYTLGSVVIWLTALAGVILGWCWPFTRRAVGLYPSRCILRGVGFGINIAAIFAAV
jgi:hypothetical protein